MFLTGAWGTDESLGCGGGSGLTGKPLQISFKDDMPSFACNYRFYIIIGSLAVYRPTSISYTQQYIYVVYKIYTGVYTIEHSQDIYCVDSCSNIFYL